MATKYVSALDGQQMDAALTDMAYHNSEAWAVGTRDGQAVSGSDVTYHNNSKYYANSASSSATTATAAAARAEAAVPPSTAGAVFFDRAQSLTDAQKGQARSNIGAGSMSANLLDNPYFVGGGSQLGYGIFPINQRGATSYTGSGQTYVFDRWVLYGKATLTSTGVKLEKDAYANGAISQYVPMGGMPQGTYTISALLTDGTFYNATGEISNNTNWYIYDGTQNNNGIAIRYQNRNGTPTQHFAIWNTNHDERNIVAVKFERGSVSTLLDDVYNFEEELRKCMAYLQEYDRSSSFPNSRYLTAFANEVTAGKLVCAFNLPVAMRVAPTVPVYGALATRALGNVNNLSGSNYTFSTSKTSVGIIDTNSNIVAGTVYTIATFIAGQRVEFNAEL